jgi:4-hydroxybenzoate polyprenyltransferase
VFFLFIVSALASGSWAWMGQNLPLVSLGTLVWYLSHLIGSQVNCLADYELDKDYKVRLARSVDQLGSRTIWVLIIAESVLALLITVLMSRMTGRPILCLLWLVGWGTAMGYSLEPLRFKRRGFLNPLSLTLVLYTLPVMYGYLALARSVETTVVFLLVAVGVQMFSLILMNEVEDIPEDTAHRILTPFVRYGIRPSVVVALLLFIVGAAGTISGLFILIDRAAVQWPFMGVAALGFFVVIKDLASLISASGLKKHDGQNQELLVKLLRTCGRRNALHFAILGLVIGVGTALTLK